jgi:hypothetical protein
VSNWELLLSFCFLGFVLAVYHLMVPFLELLFLITTDGLPNLTLSSNLKRKAPTIKLHYFLYVIELLNI